MNIAAPRIFPRLVMIVGLAATTVAFATSAHGQKSRTVTDGVGEITRFQGAGFAVKDGRYRRLRVGLAFTQGERILTGLNTRVELTMEEGSVLTLGDVTDLNVAKWEYSEPKRTGNALFELTKGAFRAVTGRIKRANNPRFAVRTPIATAGVRGTDFWGGLEFFDERLHVALIEGSGIYVENNAGIVEITEPLSGTIVPTDGNPPEPPKAWSEAKTKAAVSSISWEALE